jgi:hypothetical protein
MTQMRYTRQPDQWIVVDRLIKSLVTCGNRMQAGGMETTEIANGVPVIITDAYGAEIRTTALSGIENEGHTFSVIWVERPLKEGGTEPTPWPVEAVRPALAHAS